MSSFLKLPEEVIIEIARYLSEKDQVSLGSTSAYFYSIMPVKQYYRAFNRTSRAQWEEIRMIKQGASKEYPSGFESIVGRAKTSKELEERNRQLDKFNADIIREKIDKNSEVLIVASSGLTRFPESLLKEEALQAFWKKLIFLILSGNQLTSLPAGFDELLALRKLSLQNNRLKAIPAKLKACLKKSWATETLLQQQPRPSRKRRPR